MVLVLALLIGKKTTGFSEFGYYPFRSSTEAGPKPTFQEWFNKCYGSRFVVHGYPTVDGRGIPREVRTRVACHALELIKNGNTVLVLDSAGAERTARICEAMGYKKIQIEKN